MSRRESRDSDSKRHRSSRLDREPSPKISRRDGKPEAERVVSKKDTEVRDGTNKKQSQSLRDTAPLEPENKYSEHVSDGPRSKPSYHQHDDRPTAGKEDGRRATSERGSLRSSRDQKDNDKSQRRKNQDKGTWRHESDDTRGSLSRKRPAFSEKKIPDESRNNRDRKRTEEVKDINNRGHNDRNWKGNLYSDRLERPATGRDRVWNRDDGSRQSYHRNGDRDNRFSNSGGSGFHGSWTRAERKWGHDLFEEANKSPVRAKEEEQIAKVEALLAS